MSKLIKVMNSKIDFTPEGKLAEMNVEFSIKAQLGRPVDPDSARQKRLAKAPGKKTGRPVNPTSARQQRLRELARKRANGTLKRGRPVDATSTRQLRLQYEAANKALGIVVKRGRPVGSGKKVVTGQIATSVVVVDGVEMIDGPGGIHPQSTFSKKQMMK
jgi:hypothetical protein